MEMSEEQSKQTEAKTTTEKKFSRRDMIKWTGALAAAGAVGAGIGYMAPELMKPPPPPPVPPTSFKPPLSPEVKERVDQIVKNLVDRHADEKFYYMNCLINGCHNCNVVNRVHVKNGVITTIDRGDDTVNKGLGREDAYITPDAINKGLVQARNSCPMGAGWRKEVYDPNRIIYPMKSVGARGEAKFVRISWDEALNTVVQNLKQVKEKYGPYSIYLGVAQYSGSSPWEYYGMGFYAFGNASNGSITEANGWIIGTNSWAGQALGNDTVDMFNTKLMIFWGWNPAENNPSVNAYYMLLAKERGMKIIVIDPRYTMDSEIYADQWIPIRRDTDTAMALAIANVLFKENLVDQTFVSKWVEPEGLQKYKDYVLGSTDDKVDKTPEWAETITGVPAETTKELARLWAKSKPVALRVSLIVGRKQFGEDASRALDFLAVLTGNVGIPGTTFGAGGIGSAARRVNVPSATYVRGAAPAKLELICAPKARGSIILLREQFDNGQLSEDDFRKLTGGKPGDPLPNVRMACYSSNSVNNAEDVNQTIRATKKLEFVWVQTGYFPSTAPTPKYADIILPEAIEEFENVKGFYAGGFINNTMGYSQKSIDPLGEARPRAWVQQQIANKLGVGEKWNATTMDVPFEKWATTLEGLYKAAYEKWMTRAEIAPLNPPSWEQFNKKPIFRMPITGTPFYSMMDLIGQGKGFPTDSGKIEFFSKYLDTATPPPAGKYLRTHYYLNSYGTAFAPMPKWAWYYGNGMNARGGTQDPDVAKWPLTLWSTHSQYRQHSLHDGNPWLSDEFRHSLWISAADAKARGIKDGDLVRVSSGQAETVMPAYVTSRITPGGVDIYHGGWYIRSNAKTTLMPDGIDLRGAVNLHCQDVYPLCLTMNSAGLVQAEKFS
jgi:anaerobic dimethyl sulfoxide reductase subunit A